MLFFFAPAGIEKLFDEFSEMDAPEGDSKAANKALNALGQKFGVEYLVD